MQRATVVAEMADGSVIVEHVRGFAAFVAIALPLWRDSECERLTWHETPEPPAGELRQACCWPVRTLPAVVA